MHPALAVVRQDGNLYFMILCPRYSVLRFWRGPEVGAEEGGGVTFSKERTSMQRSIYCAISRAIEHQPELHFVLD